MSHSTHFLYSAREDRENVRYVTDSTSPPLRETNKKIVKIKLPWDKGFKDRSAMWIKMISRRK